MNVFKYGIKRTKGGCTAWEEAPGSMTKHRFRDMYHCSAWTEARNWINNKITDRLNGAKILGTGITIVVPKEFDITKES